MGHFWLRIALLLYSLGLLHAVLTVIGRRPKIFRIALGAISLGVIFHLVALVEDSLAMGHFPATNLRESASLTAFLLAGAFLVVHWRYRFQSL